MEVSSMLSGGVAVVVASASDDGRPALTRGWGPSYDEESSVMRLTVTAPAGSATLANLESNGAMAVTVSEPLTYRTAQLKGTVEHIGAPTEADRVAAYQHLSRFVEDVTQLGLDDGDRLFGGDLRVVTLLVDALFDQTPGDSAGSRLR